MAIPPVDPNAGDRNTRPSRPAITQPAEWSGSAEGATERTRPTRPATTQPAGPQGTVVMDVAAMAQRRGQPLPGPAVRPIALSLVGMNVPFASQRFPLKAGVTTVGRAPENDIVLNDPSVSALHAKIVHEQSGEWRVINLLSTNGTFVNGQRCTSAPLQAGYRLRFGNADFLISGQAPATATAATAPTDMPMRTSIVFIIALLASLTTAALLLLFWWLY